MVPQDRDFRKILPAMVHRIFFQALLQARNIDKVCEFVRIWSLFETLLRLWLLRVVNAACARVWRA